MSGVPGFVEARQALLPLAAQLAGLPDAARAALEDPASRYTFGWAARPVSALLMRLVGAC